MPRKYEKVQKLLPKVKALAAEGYTQQQIAEQLGLSGKEVVKGLLKRERKKEPHGFIPKWRGRKQAKTLQDYKHENKRLRMENELYPIFIPDKASCISLLSVTCVTIALSSIRPAPRIISILSPTRSPRRKKRSLQGCSSTVTKAFSILHRRTLS